MARVSQLVAEWHIVDDKPVRRYRFLTTALKTEKTKAIVVEVEVLSILLNYAQGKQPDDFLFPFMGDQYRTKPEAVQLRRAKAQNSYVDHLLKKIALSLGINKPLAMHSARHTFAEMLMEETGDVRLVQASLAHAKLTTTERYFATGSKQSFTDKANELYRRQGMARITVEIESVRSETIVKHLAKQGEKTVSPNEP
ncbi:tyrosine-type recombinase/integrase [Spirosoma profusum]|uniref:tyrosine-type recombinase/integrase n=1 Tax=Spirosoma profusum TaxID=2771354 RepID=UPI0021D1AAF7|nr:tyrosine-type recombinase/integrase [Spirosoma profusum]